MEQLELFPAVGTLDVLVIDDDRTAVDLIGLVLGDVTTTNYRVRGVSVADAVLEAAVTSPDVIILSIERDASCGNRTLASAREMSPTTPIVVLHDAGSSGADLDAIVTRAQDILLRDDLSATRLDRAIRCALARKRVELDALTNAYRDPVTGLGTRPWIMHRMERALSHASFAGGAYEVATLFVDLDRFKLVNDTFGHQRGDELLRAVADRLLRVVRPDDAVARLGGDEFAIVVEGHHAARLAPMIAERALRALTEPFQVDGQHVSVLASIGIALSAEGEDADELLDHADVALYRAKQTGRNCAVTFDDDMRRLALDREQISANLDRALDDDSLEIECRSILDLAAETAIGRTYSASWGRGHAEMVERLAGDGPRDVVDVAIENTKGPELGQWLISRVLQEMVEGPQRLDSGRVTIDLPPGLGAQPRFAQWLLDSLRSHGVDPSEIALWLGQREFHEDELIEPTLARLADAGLSIGLSGFGEGSSSITLFQSRFVDEVRLAPSRTQGIADDVSAQGWLRGIVTIADAVGQRVVASGVSSTADLAALRDLGCHGAEVAEGHRVLDVRTAAAPAVDLTHPALRGVNS